MSAGLKSLKVGESIYKVEPFAPREAISFGLKVAKILGPLIAGAVAGENAENIKELRIGKLLEAFQNLDEARTEDLIMQAFTRVFTPANECLENLASFNSWFKERKGELFETGFRSIMLLAEDFLPAGLKLQ